MTDHNENGATTVIHSKAAAVHPGRSWRDTYAARP